MQGTLGQMGVVGEPLLKFFALQLARGLQALHEQDYIHRDVKPENVLVGADGRVQLCDFGFAVKLAAKSGLSQGHYTTVGEVGTEGFQAPEVLERREYGFSVDVWSLGITLVALSQGDSPFPRRVDLMSGDELEFTGTNPISEQGEDFLRKILRKVPCQRLGCAAAEDPDGQGRVAWDAICQHPFLSSSHANSEPAVLARTRHQVVFPSPNPVGAPDTGLLLVQHNRLDRPPGGKGAKLTARQRALFKGFSLAPRAEGAL